MRHAIYICTKGRESDVLRFTESLALNKSEFELVILDSTEPKERFDAFRKEISRQFPFMKITHVYHQGRLPSARNAGIELGIESDLVHFFDDDVTIPSDYLTSIEQFMLLNPDTHGGGPRIKGLYVSDTKFDSRLFLNALRLIKNLRLKFRSYGKVSSSCKNHWVPDRDGVEQEVNWIPGCSMFFKPEIFEKVRFNSNMENGFRGYALGEDMEFTFRVSRQFKLMATDRTIIEHHLSPSPRWEFEFISSCSGALCAHMHTMYPEFFPKYKIYSGKFIEFTLKCVYLPEERFKNFIRMMGAFHLEFRRELREGNWLMNPTHR
jgi:GT2 family glycosyltransferase